MDRISPSTLRLVLIALGGCAVVGTWMGLSDSLRRAAPAWDQHPVVAGPAVAGPPEAVPFNPQAVETAPPLTAAPGPKVETRTQPLPATPTDPEIAAGTTPSGKPPPPKAAPKAASKSDPIADVIQEKTAPPPKADPPPEVPF